MIKRYRAFIQAAADQIDFREPAEGPPSTGLWSFFRWGIKGGGILVAIGLVISVLGGIVETFMMVLLGRVIDAIEATEVNFFAEHWGLLLTSVVVFIVIRPLLFGGLALSQSVMIGPNLGAQVLSRLHRWSLGQSVSFFDNDFAGRIAQKEMQTANSLTEVVIESINAVTFGLATVVATGILLSTVNPWLLLIFAFWFAGYVAVLRVMLPIVRRRSAARAEARASVTGQVVDTISNIKTVKLFAAGDCEDDLAISAMSDLRDKAVTFGEAQTFLRFTLMALAGLLPVGLVGTALALRGTGITAGEIATVGALSIRLSQMTGWISFTLMVIYGHIGEVQDGIETLAPADRITDRTGAGPLTVRDAGIRFEDVSFAYGRKTGGLDGVTLSIAPGERLGVVGASGAGKSTLVSLLLRLYDLEQGRITIDGQDVDAVSQDSLRRQIGVVTQDTAMFNRTAMENIRYGRTDASDEEVMVAARRAEAHEFIADLKDYRGRTGYHAFLGERGVKLSGGQRQRVSLARVILKDAPILVLDEATSALDSEVEAAIQATLATVMEGKTVIAIAHRLSTIAAMDRIIVLDQGRIVEDGSHDALLAQDGLYAGFWRRQSGGMIRTEAAE